MAGRVLSIEIGYFYTKVCELDYPSRKPKLYQYFSIPTPEGIVKDGVLKPDQAFAKEIRLALTKRKIKTKNVIFTLASSKIATRDVTIPYCKENRIMDLVRANLVDYFPIDLSQYKIAHTILAADKESGYKLLLLAIPDHILKDYETFAKELGLELKEIDYSGNSIFRATKTVCSEGTQMVLKIDEKFSSVLVEKDGVIVLNRTVPYGMETYGMREVSDEFDSEAISENVSLLASAVLRVVDYYNSNHMEEPIEKIYITGVGANIEDIEERLNRELGIKTIRLTSLSNVVNAEKVFKGEPFGEYTACIGAVIAPVHFYTETDETAAKENKAVGMNATGIAIVVLITGIVVSGILVAASLLPYLQEKKKYDGYNAIIEELQPVYEVYQNYQILNADVTRVRALDSVTITRNEDLTDFIGVLETRMPKSFCLSDMSVTTEGVVLNITVETKEEAAAVLEELRLLPAFRFVEMTSLTEVVTEMNEIKYSFSVQLGYAPVEKKAAEEEE